MHVMYNSQMIVTQKPQKENTRPVILWVTVVVPDLLGLQYVHLDTGDIIWHSTVSELTVDHVNNNTCCSPRWLGAEIKDIRYKTGWKSLFLCHIIC